MGLGTFLFMAALGLLGVIVKFVAAFVLEALNAPGKLVITPDRSGKCSKSRFVLGISLSAFLQSYVYLVYVAFVVQWTKLAMHDHGAQPVVLFAAAFAVFFPVGSRLQRALKTLGEEERSFRRELDEDFQNRANERERTHGLLTKALSVTFLLTIFAAIVFFFFPKGASILYGRTFSFLGGLMTQCNELWFRSSTKP